MKKWISLLVLLLAFSSWPALASEPITPDNLDQLETRAIFGQGAILDVVLIDEQLVFIATDGVMLYDANDFSLLRSIPFTENYMGRLRGLTFPAQQGAPLYADDHLYIAVRSNPYEGEPGTVFLDINLVTGEQVVLESLPTDVPAVDASTDLTVEVVEGDASDIIRVEDLEIELTPCTELGVKFLNTDEALLRVQLGYNGWMTAYDLETGAVLGEIGHPAYSYDDLVLVGDQLYVPTGSQRPQPCFHETPNNGVHVYDVETKLPTAFYPSSSVPSEVAVHPDAGVLIAWGRGFDLYQHDGTLTAQYTDETWTFLSFGLTFNADGSQFAIRTGETIEIFASADPQAPTTIITDVSGFSNFMDGLAWIDDLLIYPDGAALIIYNTASDTIEQTLEHADSLTMFTVNAGRIGVMVANDREAPEIRVYDLAGELLHNFVPEGVEFFGDFQYMALNEAGTIIALSKTPAGDSIGPGTQFYDLEGQIIGVSPFIGGPLFFDADDTRLVGSGTMLHMVSVPE